MGTEFFVDTGAWFALAHPADRDHEAFASQLRERIGAGARPVTTNLVIAETHALFLARAHRGAGLAFLRGVRRPPTVVVTSDEDLESRAQTDWLERFDDQDFSFTDAVSFAVMTQRGIHEALAKDRHFRTAGFTIAL
jgi:predicted nucleic acid-binding protein